MIIKNYVLFFCILLLAAFLLVFGESGLSFNSELIIQLRLPKVIACLLAGGVLAIAGLLMQIFFQNPLAGPDILGVSSGSSLFVAIWMIAGASLSPAIFNLGMSLMSFLGAMSVFMLLLFFIQKNVPKISLIIVGLLISSFASSGISILANMGEAQLLKNFLIWSMGSFRNITYEELPKFIFLSLLSLVPVFIFLKSFGQYLLSENYAKSMGLNIKRLKFLFVTLAAFQISIVTLFCGPIGFLGIIAPHLGRQYLKSTDLKKLMPATFLMGAILALFSEVVLILTPGNSLSVNAILGLIGAPIIVLYLYQQRKWVG